MQRPFLKRHINSFLQNWEQSNLPLDLSLSRYFRDHKNLGPKDRKTIGDTIYGLVRWKSLFAYLNPEDPVSAYQSMDWESILQNPHIPRFAKAGLSPYLYQLFSSYFSTENVDFLGKIFNQTAPTTIRANLLKTSRNALLDLWKDKFSLLPCKLSPQGIQFAKREALFALPEFKEGLFEVQDEGSQLIGDLVQASPKDCVLDYCSGSGGKTLALAPKMQGTGQIYLHDIRLHALQEAKKRLRRAGIQNAQCLPPAHPRLNTLIGKCDWVLVDAPCSGTGTLRRNPDQKWKIDAPMIQRLISEQREIVQKALEYVKPGGKLVYATCSVLPCENMEQVEFFLKTHPALKSQAIHSFFPEENGMDGFFGAVFQKIVSIS